jgi:hypothetical protein
MRIVKKLSLFFVASSIVFTLTSAIPSSSSNTAVKKATSTENVVKSNLNSLTVQEFLKMSSKDFSQLSGKKLTIKEKIVFSLLKKEMKANVAENKLDKNAIINLKNKMDEGDKNFDFGGFVVGLLFGLIGVGLVHIFSTSKVARRSSWKGLGAWIILLLVIALI